MGKIVVIGSSSVDFTSYAPRLPTPGETLIGSKFDTSLGGKGANQGIAATKVGGSTSLISRVGDDAWGKKYKEYLKAVGLEVSHVFITPRTTTGIAQICVANNGENQIIIVPGANQLLSIEDVKKSKDVIQAADVLIGQLETPFEATLEAFKLAKGITILNAAPAVKTIENIYPLCTMLCVNEPEASLLTDIEVKDIVSARMALSKLLAMGCNTAIITLGEKGAIYAAMDEPQPIHVLCDRVVPVDTTGAGDAFVGALGAFLCDVRYKDKPLHQIIGAACQFATASVTKEGTQTSYPERINVFAQKYKYRPV